MSLCTFLRVHGKRVSVTKSLIIHKQIVHLVLIIPAAKQVAVEDDEEAQLRELQAALAI